MAKTVVALIFTAITLHLYLLTVSGIHATILPMASSEVMCIKTTDSPRDVRKRWMVYALALSLVLHIGATLAVIIAGAFRVEERHSQVFSIQEIALTPSISAPANPAAAASGRQPALTQEVPTAARETDSPEQEPVPASASAQHPDTTGSLEKGSGLMSTPLGLGMKHGYFSGLADGRSLRDDIRGYYFEMVEKINREWWNNAGLLRKPLHQDGVFELLIQRDGTIVSIRLLQGTGSSEADRMLAKTIRDASPLPALPPAYEPDLFRAPLRIKSPTSLFR